jgi:hypothetical protein
MSEAAEDIQKMLTGEVIEVNDMANTAYMQKIKDFMRDEKTYMMKHPDIAEIFFDYFQRLVPVVMNNMAAEANKQLVSEGLPSLPAQASGKMYSSQAPLTEGVGQGEALSKAAQQSSIQNYGK